MNIKMLLLLPLLAVAVAFSGCDKDDDPKFTEDDLTVQSGWEYNDAETTLDEQAEEIVEGMTDAEVAETGLDRPALTAFIALIGTALETTQACQSDDIYTFKDDGKIAFDDNDTSCDEEGDSYFDENATWTLNGEQLTIREGTDTTKFDIVELTSTRLVLQTADNAFNLDEEGIDTDVKLYVKFIFTKP